MRTQLLQLPSPLVGQSANKGGLGVECTHSLHSINRDNLFCQRFSEYSSSHDKRQYSFASTSAGNLAASICVCPARHLKKQVLICSYVRNTPTNLMTCISDSRLHLAFELPECIRYNTLRQPSTFRVSAQNEESDKSWLQRFLFTPIDPEEYPSLLDDPQNDSDDEAEVDLRDTDGKRKGDTDDKPKGGTDGKPKGTRKNIIDDDWCKDDIDKMLADDASFAAWQQRVKARNELRESQELGRDPDNKNWEDWLDDSWGDYSDYVGGKDSGWYFDESDWEKGGVPRAAPKLPERGMGRNMKELFFRIFEDEEEVKADLAFEDRVFRFTSQTTVKFVAVLVAVPWLVSYVAHDFFIVPFLNRWVETTPLAAQILDLRRSQKLDLVEKLKLERQRVRFEAAIGKAPPLNDEELLEHIRETAIELRDEQRLENRKAFGNIWADILAGLTFFLLLVFNPDRVAIMRLTGKRLFTNVSDTGKAFLIILLSDIFLGYHSESGWETLVELCLEHYGFEVGKASIYLFVAFVPVTIDACFKLWVFRFLTRVSPSAAATFKEMKRH